MVIGLKGLSSIPLIYNVICLVLGLGFYYVKNIPSFYYIPCKILTLLSLLNVICHVSSHI